MMGGFIDLESPDGHTFKAYLSVPHDKPKGNIVVGMEMYGVNGYLQGVCDAYSRDGYIALAPALFDRFEPGLTSPYDDAGSALGKELSARTDHAHTMMDVGTSSRIPARKVSGRGDCHNRVLFRRDRLLARGVPRRV